MGRTVLSYRQALNREVESWGEFRRGLSPADQAIFDEVANLARQHADASSLAARPVVVENVFMSAIVGLLGKLKALEARVDELDRRPPGGSGAAGR
ncbi:MAG: hypothetical protein JW839_22805 [Candidatus Lokiarchaeota archaeon]|nr:hypothetical protein [Candidatus Lokiarchaeota archaeon]